MIRLGEHDHDIAICGEWDSAGRQLEYRALQKRVDVLTVEPNQQVVRAGIIQGDSFKAMELRPWNHHAAAAGDLKQGKSPCQSVVSVVDFSAMDKAAIEALLELGEYLGPWGGFLGESSTWIRMRLNCSAEESGRILQHLMDDRLIAFEVTPRPDVPAGQRQPDARWRWYDPATRRTPEYQPK